LKKDAHKINVIKPFDEKNLLEREAVEFKVPCHVCFKEGVQKMCQTSIPYFKELIVMSFSCDFCGARSTEVKTGG